VKDVIQKRNNLISNAIEDYKKIPSIWKQVSHSKITKARPTKINNS